MDPGGRAIDRTINTDLTGEQIIDGILGTGRRPPAQALGACAASGTRHRVDHLHQSQCRKRRARASTAGASVAARLDSAGLRRTINARQRARTRAAAWSCQRELQALREGMAPLALAAG